MNEKNDLLKNLSKELGVNSNILNTDNPDKLLKNIDSDKAAQVKSILNDPEKTKEILNSPQAKKLMELLGG